MGFPIAAFFLAASYLSSVLPLSKELSVTFPKQGSKIKRGKLIKITWCAHSTDGIVSVTLMRKTSTRVQEIVCLGKQDVHLEEFEWLVPFDIPAGMDYFISIKDKDKLFSSDLFLIDSN